MVGNDKYKSYLISLGEVIREYAIEAKRNKESLIGTKDEEFAAGYLCGFHRIVTLMQQHAESYDIELAEISLNDISESDLI